VVSRVFSEFLPSTLIFKTLTLIGSVFRVFQSNQTNDQLAKSDDFHNSSIAVVASKILGVAILYHPGAVMIDDPESAPHLGGQL
jgi:hypothetical protein